MNVRRTCRICGKLFTIFAVALALPIAVVACPICSSPIGQQVRTGIFGDNFWRTLAAVVSPFPVLLIVLAVYHFGLPTFWRRSKIQKL